MRLRRLDLIRYGHFTDQIVDFGERAEGRRDLHIIYGPNEAGKTTAVSAYLDLLYGIRSGAYAFLHPEATMRIGGALELGGRLHEFIRIKATANSLLDAQSLPIAESAIRAELGAIERDGYCSMFSLDDDSLEEGGDGILKSQGDLGQLLFSASAGLSELSQQLAKVRGEADAFYRFHGRQTKLAQLKERLAALKKERDAIDTQASHYAELVQTRDRLAAQHAAAIEARGAVQSRRDALQRQLLALPRLARLRALRDQLAPLQTLPEAPQAWAAALPALIRQELTLAAELKANARRIAELEAALAEMMADPAALAIADRLEGLGALPARHATAVQDIPKLKLELDEIDETIRSVLVQLGRRAETEPQRLLIEAAETGRLRDLMETRSGIEADRQRTADELAQAAQDLQQAETALANAGGSTSGEDARIDALSKAAAAARAVDHISRCRAARRLAAQAEATLQERLAALRPWQGDGTALANLAVPGEDEIQGWQLALTEAQRRIDRHAGEVDRLGAELTRLTAARDAIGETTGLVTDDAAGQIRTAREQAWAAHRSTLDEVSADRFEAALRRDDHVTDSRHLHATALADLHRTSQELAVRDAECKRATEQRDQAAETQRSLLGKVASAAGHLSLPAELSVAQLKDWLARRNHALEAKRLAQEARSALDDAADDAALAVERLSAALTAAGLAMPDAPALDALLVAADAAIGAEATLKHLRAKVRDGDQEVQRRMRAAAQAEAAATEWDTAWTAACADCWLGATGQIPTPAAARAILDALGQLGPALTARASLMRRLDSMARDQTLFAEAVAALADPLGLTVTDAAVTAKAIRDRVKAAETAQAKRRDAEDALAAAEQESQALADAKAVLADAKGKMTALFDVETLEEVEAALSALARRAELTAQRDQAEAEILDALRAESIGEAESALDAMDRDDLLREQRDLETRFDNEDASCQALFSKLSNAIDAVEAIGGDARAAEIEERRRTVSVELEDEARQYLRLRMGGAAAEQALRIYRDRHRSSMMDRASEAFAVISRGAYARLETQRRKDSEILLAITAAGGSKEAEQLSKGTRFQLYLALRVAGYHEFVRTRTPVPFVSDDIMETFDDFRAEEAFRLFADMAAVGQVIYLTHHAHLCDIAAKVCPDVQIHVFGQ